MTPELTCKELVELVTDYLEGALAHAERVRFESHLDTCSGCAAYLEQFRATIELTGRLAEDDIEAPARDALLRQFRDWKRHEGS